MDAHAGYRLLLLATFLGIGVPASIPGAGVRSLETNTASIESDWPVGDIRRCLEHMKKSNLPVKIFEVIPGIGWDNLRNEEGDLVVSYNYSLCKLTDDGELLIPDNVFTVPIKSSSIETFAELFDHWLNTSSMTSNTINVHAGLSLNLKSISGSFSYENEQLKSKQIEDKAMTTRVQARYYRYEAKLQTASELSPQFKSRLMSIAANVHLNRTEQALYEGQLLVRDFGTHVLTSVTAGAGLVKEDYLKSEFVLSQSAYKSSILAIASASFANIFQFSAAYGHKTDQALAASYEQYLTHSYVKSNGGTILQAANMTIIDWSNGVDDNLVPMDRDGDPLYFLVTPAQLPELPATTVIQVATIVRQSIELYYEMNIIPGCTKLGAPNFSFSANFDDGSCHSQPTNLTFGGTYQECSVNGHYVSHNPCDGLLSVNPKTGGMSCPFSYTAIQVQLGRPTGQTENINECHTCWLIFKCCNTVQYYSEAVYSTYWCAATGRVQKESGYLFGGLYTSSYDNLVTGTKGCPPSFYPRRILKDVDVCISDDYEFGEAYSVPFGGFFSCIAGNPLAAEGVQRAGLNQGKKPAANSLRAFMESQSGPGMYPSRCPEGYSQHLATNDLGCSIHYCVRTGSLSGPNISPIKRPPFVPKPALVLEKQDETVVFNYATQVWAKNVYAEQLENKYKNDPRYSGGNSGNEITPGISAAITVSVTLACVGIIGLITKIVQGRRAKKPSSYRQLIDESPEPTTTYGSTRSNTTAINVTT